MTKRLTLLAVLLAGCATDVDEVTGTKDPAPLEQAEAEARAALRDMDRAPYSPPGWPLEIGDGIHFGQKQDLEDRFPGWQGSTSVFWADDRPYGAFCRYESGNLPGTPAEHLMMGHHFVYEGHYPVKTKDHPDEWVWWEWEMVPPHLRDRAFIVEHLYDPDWPRYRLWSGGCSGNRAAKKASCVERADTLSAWRERLHEPWIRKYRTRGRGIMRRAIFAALALAALPLCAPKPAAAQCPAGMAIDACVDSIYSGWDYFSKEKVADWSVAAAAAK